MLVSGLTSYRLGDRSEDSIGLPDKSADLIGLCDRPEAPIGLPDKSADLIGVWDRSEKQ